MAAQIAALGICVAVLAVGSYRGVHVGILMFAAACSVGTAVAKMPIENVIAGFPLDLLVLLAGVTFFFGIAQANGTVDRLIALAMAKVGERTVVVPLACYAISAVIASMGNPAGALVMVPIGMRIAKNQHIDPVLMAICLATGIGTGGLAPTSAQGMITFGIARDAGISLNPMMLFSVALVVYLLLVASAYGLFGRSLLRPSFRISAIVNGETDRHLTRIGSGGPITLGGDDMPAEKLNDREPLGLIQKCTVAAMIVLVATVIGGTVFGLNPHVGAVSFALGSILTLADPASSSVGISRIDWGTILLVGGIITYVGVLEHLGAIEMLGSLAARVSVPLIAVLVVCVVAGLASAFASTLGMLAVVVPLAVPLVAVGGLPGWAVICSIAICASIVDVSPFSTSGATIVATSDEADRPRVTRVLIRWGLSMVVIGPFLMTFALVGPAMLT
ncbi:C4-dicarboxylate ABC transporter [Mycolicibacterium farcinogenes]|uniref:SLC13 family permease n=1 Tax=Mycolicibacterium farcinogenes TaxID=1802 RepID=UPI001C8EC66D|nr:SLC13 family permease [Mycolicibacterium farcinogenes]QZH60892.1 C4-dicarboxylate ABC transporter [Mycolicibacterium farcinogenes]